MTCTCHLTEYADIQGHRAQAAQDPGHGRLQDVPAVRTQQDPQPVGDVGTYCAPKHGQAQALSAAPADVLTDLGHARPQVEDRRRPPQHTSQSPARMHVHLPSVQ